MQLNALVKKMLFLVIFVTNDLIQVFVFLLQWPFLLMVILRRNLNCSALNGRGRTLKSRVKRIKIDIFIALNFFVVLVRFLRSLSMLGAIRREGLYFLKLSAKRIEALIIGALFGLRWKGAMALGAGNIHLTNLGRKVKGNFCLCGDSFLNGLVSGVFSTTIWLGLGRKGRP